MKYYIQKPDYQIEEKGIINERAAMDEIKQFASECLLSDYQARRAREDVAPPLIGFEDEDGAFLEFAARDRMIFSMRLEEPQQKRFLWFKIEAWQSIQVPVSHGEAVEATRLFLKGQRTELRIRLQDRGE